MVYTNRKLICGDCMNVFVFTAEEQEMNAFQALTTKTPTRCPECRASHAALRAARAASPIVENRRRY